MNFKHFIVTRFNLSSVSKEDGKDKSGRDVLTGEWLNHRLDLFNRFCLPSVVNQSEKNFTWLIYFDSSTGEDLKEKNARLEEEYPDLIKIMYVNGQAGFITSYTEDIISMCPPGTTHIISTRLDNDDIVHCDFVSRVQESFSGQDFAAVNFLKILMVTPLLKNKFHIDYIPSNHFISLIEKMTSRGIQGCYSRADRKWTDVPVIQIADKPYCIEIISEKNLVNEFRGFPVFVTKDLSDFQIRQSIRNRILDPDNLLFWKMSWRKLLLSRKYF